MKIRGKRIRNIEKYIADVRDGENFKIALLTPDNFERKVNDAGFLDVAPGIQILPNNIGTKSNFNAEGGFIKHRDREKETVYREGLIRDWHGNYHTVDIPYQRYPRTPIPAPCVELTVMENNRNELMIVSPDFNKDPANYVDILHMVNLFLELFGECDTIGDNNQVIIDLNAPVRRLNWEVLPKGEYPWERIKQNVDAIIDSVKANFQPIIKQRFEIIAGYTPDFVAIGRAGFSGYVIFGFPDKEFFILESIFHNNATYVLGDNWEELSQLTKADLIDADLYLKRFEHRVNWPESIRALFI